MDLLWSWKVLSLFQSLGCWMGHSHCPECFFTLVFYCLLSSSIALFYLIPQDSLQISLPQRIFPWCPDLSLVLSFSLNRSQLFFIPYLFTINYIFLLFKNWLLNILCFKKPGTIFIFFIIVNTVLAYEVPRITGTHWIFVEEMNVWLQCPYT